MKMRSPIQYSFAQVPEANIPRSSFKRTFAHKTTFDENYLIPFYVDEVLPGDTFNFKANLFARLTTPIVPFMDNLYLDTFYFFVPNRLVWNNFKRFMGEQANPTDSTSFYVPQIKAPAGTGWVAGSLFDYLGIPINVPGISINAMFSRAYNLIWNEWFRDQNLQNSVTVDLGDGPDTAANYVLLKRGKRHDYFTSCLPWPQKGTGVSLPLSGSAPVMGVGKLDGAFDYGSVSNVRMSDGTLKTINPSQAWGDAANGRYMIMEENPDHPGYPNVYADLSRAQAATINSLRQAFQIQKLLERDARGGTRYCEVIRSHFGVTDPMSAVLQRPVFLGGNSSPIMVTPVAQTSGSGLTGQTTPAGNLSGFGLVASKGEGFTKSFTEHGIVIGLMVVCLHANHYQYGINKMFLRTSKFDYYFPALAHLGEQSVENREIFAVATTVDGDAGDLANKAVFGYQERWAEYRYKPSIITGQLRGSYSTPLDYWHLGQRYAACPTLGATFIQEDVPVSRVVAVTSPGAHFTFDSYMECITVRPMPVYSVPGMIDHF